MRLIIVFRSNNPVHVRALDSLHSRVVFVDIKYLLSPLAKVSLPVSMNIRVVRVPYLRKRAFVSLRWIMYQVFFNIEARYVEVIFTCFNAKPLLRWRYFNLFASWIVQLLWFFFILLGTFKVDLINWRDWLVCQRRDLFTIRMENGLAFCFNDGLKGKWRDVFNIMWLPSPDITFLLFLFLTLW